MPMLAVNIIKVLFVVALYGYLFYIARSMRAHLAGPGPERKAPAGGPTAVGSGAVAPPPPAPLELEVATGDGPPRRVPVNRRLVIGRGATADIRIDDEYSSARHAVFDLSEGDVWVEDLGSTNGTTMDGTRLTTRTRLGIGMTVEIGSTRVTVR